MNIGNKIKELRLGKSITQEQLANYLSVTTQCVSKWENNVTMPDIQMLPLLSVFFGVTIDELFDLSEEAHIDRIEEMLVNKKILDPEEFSRAEKLLLKMARQNATCARYPMLLADLYNHMADGYRYLAEIQAKQALLLAPAEKYNHSLLRMAQQGRMLDWNWENQIKRIDFYKKFIKEHPDSERGYTCLLDELIAVNRLDEAEEIAHMMEQTVHGVKSTFYKGYVQWAKDNRENAEQIWQKMLAEYENNWLAYANLGDCMAHYCEYDKAVAYYGKSLEFQPHPRFTDSQISIAMIYEIMGENAKAMEAWEKVITILQEEHGITEGLALENAYAEIERLCKS